MKYFLSIFVLVATILLQREFVFAQSAAPVMGTVEVPNPQIQLVPNPISTIPVPLPVPGPTQTCPQNCSCDLDGMVLYCAVAAVPVPATGTSAPAGPPTATGIAEPVPFTSPAARPVSPSSLPKPLPANIQWSTAVPVRIEATPVGMTITATQSATGSVPLGCTVQGQTTACPATEVSQLAVPVVVVPPGQKEAQAVVTIQVDPSQGVTVTSQGVSATVVGNITVEENQLFVGVPETSSPVQILPHAVPAIAISSGEVSRVISITLKTEEAKPVYEVNGVRQARLLFFIPVNVTIATTIDATSGTVTAVERPWWSIFAW